ncbi:MAG: von Willebrand factor type A domain-containing protein, partial [Planctomycetes bacterium]|nr:von Willebrand factor type A domain-containing protein [Planctomycetota bacterium]
MNREEAEKLLAVLIFGDLDEASKTDLTAYLQTDDELRERLADMRMAVKVASDALQHGPDPVLGKKRLKHLARLARQRSNSRRSAVFTVRYMAAAAAILAAVMLPSFLIFNGTRKLKSLGTVQSVSDTGGGWSRKNDEYDIEFTGGSNALVRLEDGMPDSYGEATEESLDAKKQIAKALRGGGAYGNGIDDQVQFSLHGGQVGAENNGQSVKFDDGHLTVDGDVDEILGREITSDNGAVNLTLSDKSGPFETLYHSYAPKDAVASRSSSRGIKAGYDYESGPGGDQYKSKTGSASGIAGHGATIRAGDKLSASLESSALTDEFDSRRSTTVDSDMPAVAKETQPSPTATSATGSTPDMAPLPIELPKPAFVGTPTNIKVPNPIKSHGKPSTKPKPQPSSPGKMPPRPTRPALPPPPPVFVDAVTSKYETKSRPEGWKRETGTINTESEAASSSFRNQTAVSKNDANGKKFNLDLGNRHNATVGETSEPSDTVRYDAVIVDSVEKYSAFEEAQKDQTSTRKVLDTEGIAHDKIYTVRSKNNRIVLDEEMENADSFLISDTEGGIELTKDKNEPLPGDLPAGGPVSGRDVNRRLMGAEEMERTSEDLDDFESSGKKEAKDAEMWTGSRAELEEGAFLGVGNSGVPVGEDEPDLPPASRFKSVPVNPWVMAERDSLSTFGLDVDTASYTLCRRYIYGGFLPPAGAVRMEEFVNYFNYHYPQRADRTFTVHAEAAASPFAGKGKNLTLLKIGVKARTIGRDQRKAAHLILVVDTSASMGKPDRLGLVQQALNLLIDNLSDADRVTLITCSNQARLHLEAASVGQRDRIRQVINAIQPSGSTNLLAGLKLGYAAARRSFDPKGINHVVLCSDGVANVGQTEADAVLKAVAADRKQGIAITCVGVGYGSYNDAFLESLANRGDGSYVFLDSASQAQRVFVE